MVSETSVELDTISREFLYELVWRQPLNKAGADFGVTGPQLAQVCKRRNVPYPPLGYWQKLAVGRPPTRTLLPSELHREAKDQSTLIALGSPDTKTKAYRRAVPLQLTEAPRKPAQSDELDELEKLHPKIRSWLQEHKQEQRERNEEIKRRKRETWGWARNPIPDLTDRDIYRFRASSTVCHAVEQIGGKVLTGNMRQGLLTLRVNGTDIELKVVEKMTQSPNTRDSSWTAFGEYLRSGLQSSGYLRAAVTTFAPGKQPEWVETDRKPFSALVVVIAERLLVLSGELQAWQLKKQVDAERYQREEAERYARRREQELDDKRWAAFASMAGRWRERELLTAFIEEIERRRKEDANIKLEGLSIDQWLAWARNRTDVLDPFSDGEPGIFEVVVSAAKRYW